ncbi:hypothetical protein HYO99_gp12 [Roseobacter phage RD-1410W1-01]|uniref:Uncharacterized protein n=1 Tax=Roseobacter phage RD-1410W1-01 TaxID=1815984 RepID=A0A191VYF8_9CAUD|nr:hypothetical protein HYO99_gp12 [Roseobacter phage RD-1410W1-01]ANJ20746.1 hypothetical protein RDp01_gp12 [Roseobacter phage RD-1410W1-01]
MKTGENIMAFQLNNRSKTTQNSARRNEREPSEFDGIWLNVGVEIEIDGEIHFARLNKGIALADLEVAKISPRTVESNPSYAAQLSEANKVVKALQKGGLQLDHGDAAPLKLAVQMYRTEEASQNMPEITDSDVDATAANIFG